MDHQHLNARLRALLAQPSCTCGAAQQAADGSLLRRLLTKTAPAHGGCIAWTGYINRHGYGHIHSVDQMVLVHRAAYELLIGSIPAGHTLDHVCHTRQLGCFDGVKCLHRRCINPLHLKPVTPEENARLAHRPGRRSPESPMTHCHRGHEFTPDNTYTPPGRPNSRFCRQCLRIHQADRRTRERASVMPCGHVSPTTGGVCQRPAGHEGRHSSKVGRSSPARVQDARDYAEAQARQRDQSNRDDAQLQGPKAGAR